VGTALSAVTVAVAVVVMLTGVITVVVISQGGISLYSVVLTVKMEREVYIVTDKVIINAVVMVDVTVVLLILVFVVTRSYYC